MTHWCVTSGNIDIQNYTLNKVNVHQHNSDVLQKVSSSIVSGIMVNFIPVQIICKSDVSRHLKTRAANSGWRLSMCLAFANYSNEQMFTHQNRIFTYPITQNCNPTKCFEKRNESARNERTTMDANAPVGMAQHPIATRPPICRPAWPFILLIHYQPQTQWLTCTKAIDQRNEKHPKRIITTVFSKETTTAHGNTHFPAAISVLIRWLTSMEQEIRDVSPHCTAHAHAYTRIALACQSRYRRITKSSFTVTATRSFSWFPFARRTHAHAACREQWWHWCLMRGGWITKCALTHLLWIRLSVLILDWFMALRWFWLLLGDITTPASRPVSLGKPR